LQSGAIGCRLAGTASQQEDTMYDMKNLAALKTMDAAAEAGMQAF
jgi:hypothetical protein